MKVLILGGAGLLGSHLVGRLSAAGHEVAICDNFSGSIQYRVPKDVRVFSANATDLNSMEHVFKVFVPEAVVSCLAHYFSPDTTYRFFDDSRLCLESANVLTGLVGPSVKHVLFCSSHEVYGGSSRPLKESRKIKESYSYHGAAKLSAELMLGHHCQEVGVPLTIVRVFDLFGPRIMFCARTGVVSFLIDSLLNNEQVGFAGPARLKDFIHVDDAASAIQGLLDSETVGTFNLGTGRGVTIKDLFSEAQKHIRVLEPPYLIPDSEGKKKSLVADISLLRRALPEWEPKTDVLSAFEQMVAFRKGEAELYSNTPENALRVLNAMRGKTSV